MWREFRLDVVGPWEGEHWGGMIGAGVSGVCALEGKRHLRLIG